jgi:hypothetical protein
MKISKQILWMGVAILLGFKTAFGQGLITTNHVPLKTDLTKLTPPPTLTVKPAGAALAQGGIPLLVKKPALVQSGATTVSAQQAGALPMMPAPVLRPVQK